MKKEKGRDFWYRGTVKKACALGQGILAGLAVLCFLTVRTWSEGEFPFFTGSPRFENTAVFMNTVEDIIREKIYCDQNRELFEPNGTLNENRLIDIRQYTAGALDEASANRNTTYHLSDLLAFASADALKLEELFFDLLGKGMSEEEAGNALMDRAGQLESILPISGMSLADYADLNANPALTALECYRELFETSLDIADRYEEYSQYVPDEASSAAPSNVAYYIENTGTRQRYTNQEAASLAAAQYQIREQKNLTVLFEGERRFNIMVTDAQQTFSEQVSHYFMQTRFVGTGEKVLIAVDMEYPLGDELHDAYVRYQRRLPWIAVNMGMGASMLLVLIFLFIQSFRTAGRNAGTAEITLSAFDQIPTEIAAGLGLIGAMIWWMLSGRGLEMLAQTADVNRGLAAALRTAVEYEMILLVILSFLRRARKGTLWKNSVCYYVLQGTRQVYRARKSSQRLLLTYLVFIGFNLLFLLIGGAPGFVMALVLNLAALLYLMRDVVGNETIREGLSQLSEGKLDYRINTDVLTGESRDMGNAVNEMGDGLQKAVESMLKNERLRAELITNVSHDLKTPLTSIVNYVDLLGREELPGERAKEYVHILKQKTQRLKQLTEDLIEVSRISSGNVELHPVRLQLKDFILQAGGEFEDRLQEKGVHLRTELPEQSFAAVLDGASLWRVFENLLGNMVKYAKEDTEALISLQPEGDAAKITFSNVSAEELTLSGDQLKERFVRGDASRRTEGSGLGLSIAESLTKLMGGTFDIFVKENLFAVILSFPVLPEK